MQHVGRLWPAGGEEFRTAQALREPLEIDWVRDGRGPRTARGRGQARPVGARLKGSRAWRTIADVEWSYGVTVDHVVETVENRCYGDGNLCAGSRGDVHCPAVGLL